MWIPSNNPEKDFNEDKHCYTNKCNDCEYLFPGHSHRRVCKECTTKKQ